MSRIRLATAGAVTIAMAFPLATAGCGPGVFDPVRPAAVGHSVVLTEQLAPSALVAVTSVGRAYSRLFQVLAATARPREHLDIVAAGGGTQDLIASVAPPAATVQIRARPIRPSSGSTSFQEAGYQRQLRHWKREESAGHRAVTLRTAQAITAWIRPLLARAALLADPAAAATPTETGAGAPAASMIAECGVATNVLSGLVDQAGARFSGRVLVLATGNIGGMPPAGELDGDDVLVLTPFVPGSTEAAAAQQDLIAAGAARAAILGPEATPSELDQIVANDLDLRQATEAVSGSALFANDSVALLPAAARVLAPLVARLEQPGVTAVVNGYASAPGSSQHNQQLSQNRAAAVAGYLEAHGVSPAVLFVVGHGASDFVAPGSSRDNRRVVIVIEEPIEGA
jgi:outer membrane protein OmpA-like peptidoglycan-associated protein